MEMVGYLYKTHKMLILSVRLEKKYKQLNYNKPKLIHNQNSLLISSWVGNLKGHR
jgi:hypothetical protein